MIELGYDAYTARVNPRGGGLASLTYDGADLVVPQDGMGGPPRFRGAVLMPWSNRIGDGRYRFGDDDYRLPITEPERGNALHGLVLEADWQPIDASPSAVRLALRLGPVSGYPFWLDLALTYALSDTGLDVTLVATNTGDSAAPYGCGFHPYLRPGGTTIDDAVLELNATERLLTDPIRLLPAGREKVSGGGHDFSGGRRIGLLELDDAFTGVASESGVHHLRLGDIEAWWDTALRWIQVFTPPDRSALAVEPCTAPPDAFRTGDDLVRLAPGSSHRVRWGLRRVPVTEAGDTRAVPGARQ